MSAGKIEEAKRDALRRGDPFPLVGPPLPAGWVWAYGLPLAPPHRAEHVSAPCHIKRRKDRSWVAYVRNRALRVKDGVYVLVEAHGKRGAGHQEGEILTFLFPQEAANAAVSFLTGARVRM